MKIDPRVDLNATYERVCSLIVKRNELLNDLVSVSLHAQTMSYDEQAVHRFPAEWARAQLDQIEIVSAQLFRAVEEHNKRATGLHPYNQKFRIEE